MIRNKMGMRCPYPVKVINAIAKLLAFTKNIFAFQTTSTDHGDSEACLSPEPVLQSGRRGRCPNIVRHPSGAGCLYAETVFLVD